MSDFEVWIIIILVVGVIASNLAVLKYSAKFKMPQFGSQHKHHIDKHKPEKQTGADGETKPESEPEPDESRDENSPDTK